jgi:hypothetical protein
MKVVINKCFGGFSLSEAGVRRYAEIKGLTLYPEYDKRFSELTGPTWWIVPPEARGPFVGPEEWHSAPIEERKASNERHSEQSLYDRDIPRDDPALVQVVEELGEAADGRCAALRVVEIPDGTDYEIGEYDGMEHVAEKHRTWA